MMFMCLSITRVLQSHFSLPPAPSSRLSFLSFPPFSDQCDCRVNKNDSHTSLFLSFLPILELIYIKGKGGGKGYFGMRFQLEHRPLTFIHSTFIFFRLKLNALHTNKQERYVAPDYAFGISERKSLSNVRRRPSEH